MHTIFYAWQSDLPNNINRGFIESCLERAIREINHARMTEEQLTLDKDTQGRSGMPDVSRAIFEKIDDSAVFVPDLTITSAGAPRPSPNPNVLIELGYALKALGDARIVGVFNDAVGSVDQLPFDLRTRRWPICYSIGDQATDGERAASRKELTSKLVSAITAAVQTIEQGPRIAPQRAQSMTFSAGELPGPFANGVSIANVDASVPGVAKDGTLRFRSAPQATIDLRPAQPKNTETYVDLRTRAVSHDFSLTGFGPRGTQWISQNRDGFIFGDVISTPRQPSALCFTQLYKRTGALYGINQAIAFDHNDKACIDADQLRSDLVRALSNYLEFYRRNEDFLRPLKLYLTLETMHGRYLALSGPNALRYAGPCVENLLYHNVDEVEIDAQPLGLVSPLLQKLWDSVGLMYEG